MSQKSKSTDHTVNLHHPEIKIGITHTLVIHIAIAKVPDGGCMVVHSKKRSLYIYR